MKKYLFIFMIINIFFITNVYAYNFSPQDFRVQAYEGNTWKAETTESGVYMGYAQFPINATSDTNTLRILWDSGNVDLTTTGYSNYDLTTFNFKIYNNSLSAGVEPITSISAFGNSCFYQATRFTYQNQESLQGSAYCPGAVPNQWGNLASIILINYASFTPSTLNLSNVSVTATNGKIFESLEDIKQYLASSSQQDTVNAINNQTNVQIQQHNQIMNNDSTSYNSGIESIAGNTQLPNNSGLFDVLSSLSTFVGNLSVSGTCSPLTVPIPFTNQSVRLPCMTTEIYARNFPQLLAIWQLIVRGIVYYYIIVNLLKLLKDTIDPFSMKLEVLDL